MLICPKYASNIIAGIMGDTGFEWYVTNSDVWILDINKYANAFIEYGFSFDKAFALSIRGNTEVVNEETIDTYLLAYEENIVPTNVLEKLIREKKYNDTILSLRPSLYIDITVNKLLSIFPETLAYEKYIPDGWVGRREDFTQYIPMEERYWIVDGIDMINEEFINERQAFKRGN